MSNEMSNKMCHENHGRLEEKWRVSRATCGEFIAEKLGKENSHHHTYGKSLRGIC